MTTEKKLSLLAFIIIVVVALAITVGAAIYQKKTGPTYPLHVKTELAGKELEFELLRSHGGETDAEVILTIPAKEITGEIVFRKFPTNDEWTVKPLERKEDTLVGVLPHQPPAAKLEYYLVFKSGEHKAIVGQEKPVAIRFKGAVPDFVLIPHIFFMFVAMFLSNFAGILALFKDSRFKFYMFLAFGFLAIGGMILGPIVQQYAFGELWTGVPFGWDLTDNKTLLAFAAFIIAVIGNRKKERPWLVVAAAVVVLVIFMIPHSMFGSEYDYSKGVITQG